MAGDTQCKDREISQTSVRFRQKGLIREIGVDVNRLSEFLCLCHTLVGMVL